MTRRFSVADNRVDKKELTVHVRLIIDILAIVLAACLKTESSRYMCGLYCNRHAGGRRIQVFRRERNTAAENFVSLIVAAPYGGKLPVNSQTVAFFDVQI